MRLPQLVIIFTLLLSADVLVGQTDPLSQKHPLSDTVATSFGGAEGGVLNSPHNLAVSISPSVLSNNQVCLPCHTPHKANDPGGLGKGALWNHGITTATFTTYTNRKNVTAPQPTGSSKLCLSCHDGTIAVDQYGGRTGTVTIGTGALLGTDLSDDHPIEVEYPTTDTAYRDPTAFAPGIGTAKGVQLVDGKVGCRSCHHSHNNLLGDFLRVPRDDSFLCRQCHKK